jgi:hypothetical protein
LPHTFFHIAIVFLETFCPNLYIILLFNYNITYLEEFLNTHGANNLGGWLCIASVPFEAEVSQLSFDSSNKARTGPRPVARLFQRLNFILALKGF